MTGIVLGLGFGFMHEGIVTMSRDWPIAIVGLLGTVLLLKNKMFPAIFALLAYGLIAALVKTPTLWDTLHSVHLQLRLPTMSLAFLNFHELLVGGIVLALPQIPLTLGNAIIAVCEENNRLFPDRLVTEDRVATSTGAINILSAAFGGFPMCHGAGGMAGHVTFGANTGGAPIILGTMLLLLAFFCSGSIALIIEIFPPAVLGVVLFITGAQLALGSCNFGQSKQERFIALVVAAFSIWNVGLGFAMGIVLNGVHNRGWLRL